MAKKKKMTKAQAAAARKEVTHESLAKERSREHAKVIRAQQSRMQREASKSTGFRLLVPFVLVLVIAVAAIALTIGPGMLMGS